MPDLSANNANKQFNSLNNSSMSSNSTSSSSSSSGAVMTPIIPMSEFPARHYNEELFDPDEVVEQDETIKDHVFVLTNDEFSSRCIFILFFDLDSNSTTNKELILKIM